LPARDGSVSLHLFLDTSSVEVFGNGGEVVLTELILPRSNVRSLKLTANSQPPRVKKIEVWELKSAWQ
jgi:fructan beta-fructosidase